jgi:nitric oxide reductase NorD protein
MSDTELRFSSIEHRLGLFIGALWGRYPKLQSMAMDGIDPPRRVTFGGGVIRVPERFRGVPALASARHFRAALAHAGAHFHYTRSRFPPGALKPIQIALVSLIEDARIEQLAMRDFPGLRRLFLPFHVAAPQIGAMAPALLARLSRALIDPNYADDDAWIEKGRALFYAAADDWRDPAISRRIGGLLGNDLGQMRMQFNPKTYVAEPSYRDDNLGLWAFPDTPPDSDADETLLDAARVTQSDTEPPRNAPDSGPGAPADSARPAAPSDETGTPLATYPEWDYAIRQHRVHWTTLRDYPVRQGHQAVIDDIITKYAPLAHRLEALIRTAQVSRPHRLRRQAEGDALDLDACIAATISRRHGEAPDPLIHSRTERRHRDLATLLLLDVSHSTNDRLPHSDATVLALERAAAALLGDAMAGIGDRFAIRAFCSNGRHDVRYGAIKDFAAPFDIAAKRRLAGLAGALSTRLGAALRHAGQELARQITYRRLLLVVSDGEPSDIDAGDRRYLVEDARHAVQELGQHGIDVFCVGLDAGNNNDFTRIFGGANVMRIDRIERLPEKLPLIYLRLTA